MRFRLAVVPRGQAMRELMQVPPAPLQVVGETLLPHLPVEVLQVLLAMVCVVFAHRPSLPQLGVVWMQLVPLWVQLKGVVERRDVHWLLLQAGVDWVQLVPLMRQVGALVVVFLSQFPVAGLQV